MEAMGDVLPYRPPRARQETNAFIGMIIFLASWAMMFASLFFAYGFVRSRALSWPPAGVPELPRLLPFANTCVLALSSVALALSARALRRNQQGALVRWVVAAIALGSIFLGLQLWLWLTLNSVGLKPGSAGVYSSVFYGLTWLHAVHVLVGLGGLATVWRHAWRGQLSFARALPLRLWSMYWHFVGAVWALMFVTIFLV